VVLRAEVDARGSRSLGHGSGCGSGCGRGVLEVVVGREARCRIGTCLGACSINAVEIRDYRKGNGSWCSRDSVVTDDVSLGSPLRNG
jgi:hypothetical protein